MSEITTDTTAPTETDGQAGPEERDWKAEAEKQKSFAREQEKRAKENAAKARDYDAYVESQKTEQQKLTDRLSATERELSEARTDALKFRIAAKHGLSEDDFDLLGSGTEEQIEARAKRIQALSGGTAPAAGSSSRPKERLHPGATPSGQAGVSAADEGLAEAQRRFGPRN